MKVLLGLTIFVNALLAQGSTVIDKKFKINDGEYIGEGCFLKVETIEERTHIKFAHKDFLITDENNLEVILGERNLDIEVLTETYNSDLPFNSTNIPGISVIYNNELNWVEFGPALCNKRLSNIRTRRGRNSWGVGCGSKFSRTNVDLNLYAYKNHDLKRFTFTEKYNKSRRFFILAPWKQRTVFSFSCEDMKLVE